MDNIDNSNVLIFSNLTYEFDSKNFEKDFTNKSFLGTGKFTVESYLFEPLNIRIAIKLIRIPHSKVDNPDEQQKILGLVREVTNLRSLSTNPNIITCFGVCLHDGQALICMEQMDMSLKDVYKKIHAKSEDNQVFPEKLLGCIAVSLVDALAACKKINVIHRDVKPENVLLNKTGEIVLCDFSEARILNESAASTFVGKILIS